ncbi:unnamed protein product [Cuscuta campestris]|uniref:Bulb-type lectin domain-containing protein n=1 Tax=Cuscuta campestris TaxID=132261 RepID=A0A484LYP8_9ASTE|nr:unnamed protein product [Cuscuta campestris]
MGRQTWCRFASFLSFLLIIICRCSSTTNTISLNQTLKDGDFLFSNSKSFVLGFFTPQNSAGNRRYIGIWFQQIPVKTIVWVANRDSPVNGESGVLCIDAATGNLVIRDEKTNASVWSTNLTGGAKPGSDFSGRLLNNGNLVLGPEGKESPTWQSFDFPTNTLLPSMKLSMDKKPGGGRRVLTSWKSAGDPATGQYALGMELSGTAQVFLYRSWAQIWRAGPWNGVELSGSPEISRINPAVNLNYAETDGEVSLTFSLRDQSVQSILVLNESGTVNRLTWRGEDKGWVGIWSAPEDKCDVYGGCGAFSKCDLAALECSCLPGFEPRSGQESPSDGCTRGNNTDASSLCHKGEGFTKLTKVKMPDAKTAVVNHQSIGLDECNQICLNNCSCTGYTTANVSSGSGCITWYGELIDMRELANGGQDLFLRISADDLRKLENKSKGHRKVITVCLAVVSVAVILLLCWLAMHIRKETKKC